MPTGACVESNICSLLIFRYIGSIFEDAKLGWGYQKRMEVSKDIK
jgi:hypothetical protein